MRLRLDVLSTLTPILIPNPLYCSPTPNSTAVQVFPIESSWFEILAVLREAIRDLGRKKLLEVEMEELQRVDSDMGSDYWDQEDEEEDKKPQVGWGVGTDWGCGMSVSLGCDRKDGLVPDLNPEPSPTLTLIPNPNPYRNPQPLPWSRSATRPRG